MGFRDRFKKMLGRGPDNKAEAVAPPKPRVRARAIYRTGSERRIEGAEHVLEEPQVEAVPAAAPEPEEPLAPLAEQDAAAEADTPAEAVVTYQVHLVNEDEDLDVVIEVEHGEYILDAAERQAIDLPSSCRAGGCYVCAGTVLEGELDLSEEQVVLDDEHLEAGLTLLCCASPRSDARIRTHQEDAVF